MTEQAPSLGIWLSLYCALSIIVGVGLFMFALIGLKNIAGAPDGLGLIVFLFFAIAFINFFLVYRLMAVKTATTIYLVRAFEGMKLVLASFALFSSGPEVILYLLISLVCLVYFFKSKRVKEVYFYKPDNVTALT